MSKSFKYSWLLTLAVVAVYIVLFFIHPSKIITKILHVNFNTPERVDSIFFRELRYLVIAGVLFSVILWLLQSRYRDSLILRTKIFLIRLASFFSLKVLIYLSLIYLVALFYFAVFHYDLGFDEAWYIYYAKNFAKTGIPFAMDNGKISLIDNISMLPYYILTVINFKTGLTDVVYFKLISSLFSWISLIIFFRAISKFCGRSVAIIALFILIAQPGFGFVASSYFGEVISMGFVFMGLYIWLKEEPPYRIKTILCAALLFSFALNTKLQLAIVLLGSLLLFSYTDRKSSAIKVFIYTIIFTFGIIFIRSVPILIRDPKLMKFLVLISGFGGDAVAPLSTAFLSDKLELFNRFFPLPVMVLALAIFPFRMKNSFERFLFLFTSITFFWWILFSPYSTYRIPFVGIITLSIIIAILVREFYEKSNGKKSTMVKFATAISVIIIMVYGFSANIMYAYVGYNDGVQFDLDGTRSRLFSPVSHDNSQKEFYSELKNMTGAFDTLYNGSYVTQCYLENPIASIQNLKESMQTNPARKLLLITRERYPQGLEKGRQILDSLGAPWRLALKNGDYELYVIKK